MSEVLDILPYTGRTLLQLVEEGYREIRDVPAGRLTNESQERVRRVTQSGRRF